MPARPPRKNKQIDDWIRPQDLKRFELPPAYHWPDRDLIRILTGDDTQAFQGDWKRFGEDVVKIMCPGFGEYGDTKMWVLGFTTDPLSVFLLARKTATYDPDAEYYPEDEEPDPEDEEDYIQIVCGPRGYRLEVMDLVEGAEVILHNALQIIPPYVTPVPKTTPVYRWPTRSWFIGHCKAQGQEDKFPPESQWMDWGLNAMNCLWANLETFEKVRIYLVGPHYVPGFGVLFFVTSEGDGKAVLRVDNLGVWQVLDFTDDIEPALAACIASNTPEFYPILPPPTPFADPTGGETF